MAGYKCAVSRDMMSMLGVMYDRSWVTKRREAVEESLQCSRAVSQPAEEAAHSPLRAAAGLLADRQLISHFIVESMRILMLPYHIRAFPNPFIITAASYLRNRNADASRLA